MASTFSALKIELIGTGEQTGSWGNTTNINLGQNGAGLEQAIVGMATLETADFTANVYTLPYASTNVVQDFRALVLNITATLSAAGQVIVPAIQKPYIVLNNSVGGFAVTVKVTGQTGVSVPNGAKILVYNNGTDVGAAITHLTSLTLASALPVASGGTGASTLTANNVVIGNGASAVQFVAPGTVGNVLTSDGTTWTSASGGSGDVAGPASATDNAVARFDGTTGNLIQSSAVTIADNNDITTAARIFTQNGSNAAPAISSSSDTDTGISFSGANNIRLSTGGAQRLLISSAGVTVSNDLLMLSERAFPFGERILAFGTVLLYPADPYEDVDLSFTLFQARGYTHYHEFQVAGVYDAGNGTTYAYNNKHWQQNIVWTGSEFSIAGANLIGTVYNSDATNFPAGAVSAAKIQTIASSGTMYNLRLSNRNSPAAASNTYYTYYVSMLVT